MSEALWAGVALVVMTISGLGILWFESLLDRDWESGRDKFKQDTGLDIGPRPHDEEKYV